MSNNRAAPHHDLRDPARRRPVPEDLRRIWRRRHFLVYAAVSDMRAREADSLLGAAWYLVSPMLHIAVYYLVFGLLLGTNRGLDNFLPFLAIGVFVFDLMRKVVVGGARALVANRGLIESIPFPRAVLPLSVTVSETIAFAPPAAVMVAVTLLTGEPVTWRWAALPGVFLLHTMFTTGLGLAAARITYHIRDFGNILPILFRLAFYMSGVLHLMEEYLTSEWLLHLVSLNPFYGFISMYRWALMGLPVSSTAVVAASTWAVGALGFGYLWFRARERDYGRER